MRLQMPVHKATGSRSSPIMFPTYSSSCRPAYGQSLRPLRLRPSWSKRASTPLTAVFSPAEPFVGPSRIQSTGASFERPSCVGSRTTSAGARVPLTTRSMRASMTRLSRCTFKMGAPRPASCSSGRMAVTRTFVVSTCHTTSSSTRRPSTSTAARTRTRNSKGGFSPSCCGA